MIKSTDIDINKIRFLEINKNDLILALDRLTRFKHPEKKYYRVFSEIICKYLLEPKLSKNTVKNIDTEILKSIVETIWNSSVKKHFKSKDKKEKLKKILLEETISTYCLSEETKSLIDINLQITPILQSIENEKNLPINLKRLIILQNSAQNSIELRKRYKLLFPVKRLVLCEGITEEILLTQFANLAGFNFDENGIKLISAGGKNQVAKLYCELKDELKIPIFILLDADAKPTAELLNNKLRYKDRIYLIQHGEFEDIFSLNLIKRTINKRYKNICECSISDFKKNEPMTKILADFYRIHELGDFQKADFAKEVAETLKYDTDLTEELLNIVEQIKHFYK